jgi:hypothetical protein
MPSILLITVITKIQGDFSERILRLLAPTGKMRVYEKFLYRRFERF